MMKRFAAVLMILLLLPLAAFAEAAEPTAAPQAHTVEKKTYPHVFVYDSDAEPTEEEMNLYFVDGGDIPYVALSEYIPFLTRLVGTVRECEIPLEISIPENSGDYAVTRTDNGSTLLISPEENILMFSDFNGFLQEPGTSALVSVMSLPDPIRGEIDTGALMQFLTEHQDELKDMPEEDRKTFVSAFMQDQLIKDPVEEHSFFAATRIFNLQGDPLVLNLLDYGIDIIAEGGECYLPFQVMNNLLVSPTYIHYIFNGQKIIGDLYSAKLDDIVREAAPEDLSDELATYNYNALRFFLDNCYGLKQEHRIDSFSSYLIISTGIMNEITGTDSAAFESALSILTNEYLDDGHSGFVKKSWRTADADPKAALSNAFSMMTDLGSSNRNRLKISSRLTDVRKKYYPDGVPGYEEIGDTAFITFDSFTSNSDHAHYYSVDSFDDPQDTIELIIHAHRQITRENSPVKNIVLDLSLNGGGTVSAAVAVASWFTGSADILLRDTLTGAETNVNYCADINLNGKIVNDPEDHVSGGKYRLFCLISPTSFSCGNLLPALCRTSGLVTLIGRRSGGGSNVVLPATTASGTLFQISGTKQLSTSVNGSYINIDSGIEPDVILTDLNSYYDRTVLLDLIHGLK